ncbi:GSCFA domain-containing protein [Mesobacterium pallidum]|uniref:GSCFA domain-containing protein n=1 Tax=Mesobacterium pallidum TaxID=2872037 RepID=UPI001EE1C324|nr:GSCFA domain-containing protein [Mesobacterium pallidum]
MSHPYQDLPASAYWRSAVSNVSPLELADIYQPKFRIGPRMQIAAAGSCFAQHISREFKQRGFRFLDVEPAPAIMPAEQRAAFGLGLYSGRFGNIYSVRQLVQMFERAQGTRKPPETCWEQDGRFYDPFRPAIQPNGFASREELDQDVAWHLSQVLTLLEKADLFVFTFGLTEGWAFKEDGTVLPTCPGTVAGTFDPDKYEFVNFTHRDIVNDTRTFIQMARAVNPRMRFLFTISPVPLTATASGKHVLVASSYSKSVLRAAVGMLADEFAGVDYFPSYELVASHPMRAMFFDPNLRTVSPVGVGHVMNTFFSAHPQPRKGRKGKTKEADPEDLVCEEAILETFGK